MANIKGYIEQFLSVCRKNKISNDDDFEKVEVDGAIYKELFIPAQDIVTSVCDFSADQLNHFDWHIQDLKYSPSLVSDIETSIKRSLVYSERTLIELPIAVGTLHTHAYIEFFKLLFRFSSFLNKGYGIMYPNRLSQGCGLSGAMSSKTIANPMNLYASTDKLTDIGNYILCDITYPTVANLSVDELERFRQDEGNIFRIFNARIFEIVSSAVTSGLDNTQAIKEMFQKVDYEVRRLKVESENIQKHSHVVKFECIKFSVYGMIFLGSNILPGLNLIMEPSVIKALQMISGFVGVGQASDVVKAYYEQSKDQLKLRENPFYWPHIIQARSEKK